MVDASAVVELLLRDPARTSALADVLLSGRPLHAPHLLDVEVASALRRYVLRGDASAERMFAALEWFADLRVHRHPHRHSLQRMWQLRENLTAYDACYVALAESLDAPLVTCDARLADARGHSARIQLVA